MKTLFKIHAFLLLLFTSAVISQDIDTLTVNLSDPAKPAAIKADFFIGSISVKTHAHNYVMIISRPSDKKMELNLLGDHPIELELPSLPDKLFFKEGKTDPKKIEGLTQIQPARFAISANEEENTVEINVPPIGMSKNRDIEIWTPVKTSLNLKSFGGDVNVNDIDGEIEIEAFGGNITLNSVSGAVIANTQGDINGTIKNVTSGKPLSFSSFNGEIDITLPRQINATLDLKSHGEIYTDFDAGKRRVTRKSKSEKVGFDLEEDQEKIIELQESQERIIELPLNGGGEKISITTFSGNIYIRKGK